MDEAREAVLAQAEKARQNNKEERAAYLKTNASFLLEFGSGQLAHQTSWMFHPDVHFRVVHAHEVVGTKSVVENILGLADRCSVASSCQDFIDKTSPLFSDRFQAHLQVKLDNFNNYIGEPLAATMLAADTVVHWATEITRNSFFYYAHRPDIRGSPEMGNTALASPESLSPITTRLSSSTWALVMQQDVTEPVSPVDTATSDPEPASSAASNPCPIEQIRLQGTSLKEAWMNNEIIKQLADYETIASPDWTPEGHGLASQAPCFHGAGFHLHSAEGLAAMESALSMPAGFCRSNGPSQIYPNAPDLAGFYTTFSFWRAFAAALFHVKVVKDPPSEARINHLQESFNVHGRSYQGVMVAKFWSTKPAPTGLLSYTVPRGQQRQWASQSHNFVTYSAGSKAPWTAFKPIHGQNGTDFPDLVHMREQDHLVQGQARPFHCNEALLWQTAWVSKQAIDALNANIAGAWFITWDRPEPGSAHGTISGAPSRPRKRDRVLSLPQVVMKKMMKKDH